MNINPDAVWDDGSPITIADFKCTVDATLNTPGSLSTVGYDKITSIDQGASDQRGRRRRSPRCTRRTRTCSSTIIKADAVADCNDVSADLLDEIPFSGRAVEDRVVEPRPADPRAERGVLGTGAAERGDQVVMVPKADSDTEIASLRSGESDFIFPQAYAGITDALTDPNIKYTPGYGTNYEGLYFQQATDESRRSPTTTSVRRSPSRSTVT